MYLAQMHVFSKHFWSMVAPVRRCGPTYMQIPQTQGHHRYAELTSHSCISVTILWRLNGQSLLPSLPSFSSTYCHSCPSAVGLGHIHHAHCLPKPHQSDSWVILPSTFLYKQLLLIHFIYCNLSCYRRLLLPNIPTHSYSNPQQKRSLKRTRKWWQKEAVGKKAFWKHPEQGFTRHRNTDNSHWSRLPGGASNCVCSRILCLAGNEGAHL